LALFIIAVFTANNTEASPHKKGQTVRVRFLATSTLFRTTWGTNEDAYLAELEFPKGNEQVLVRLIDEYPSAPLSEEVLRSNTGTNFIVKRDAGCDRPFGQILLRTAPGDPMAVLPERLSYRPLLERTPAPGTILPCYRVLRR
jgi:hypothetical protein